MDQTKRNRRQTHNNLGLDNEFGLSMSATARTGHVNVLQQQQSQP